MSKNTSSNLKDKPSRLSSGTGTIVNDKFWLDDPTILISSDRLTEFFPNKLFTLDEKLNSLVRLSMYISIILIFYFKNIKWSNVFLFSLLLTYYIHINKPTKTGPEQLVETFRTVAHDSQPAEFPSSDPVSNKPEETTQNQSECTKPTLDNPFMNMTMKDYLNFDTSGKIKERLPACDTTNPDIKQAIDNNFKNNLYRDVNDVFGRFNSERQFFTMPSTDIIPDIKGEFKHWLYNSAKTCKEDQDYCLRYEDIRGKQKPVPT
jgi:hypothetical protein